MNYNDYRGSQRIAMKRYPAFDGCEIVAAAASARHLCRFPCAVRDCGAIKADFGRLVVYANHEGNHENVF